MIYSTIRSWECEREIKLFLANLYKLRFVGVRCMPTYKLNKFTYQIIKRKKKLFLKVVEIYKTNYQYIKSEIVVVLCGWALHWAWQLYKTMALLES